MEICKQQSEIEMRHLPAISIYGYVGGRLRKKLAVRKKLSSLHAKSQ